MSRGTALTLALLVTLAIAGCTTDAPAQPDTAASKTPVGAPSADATAAAELKLPTTFPKDVPVLASDLVVATDLGAGWLVFMTTAAPADDFAAASELLTSAGFEKLVSTADGVSFFGSFTNDKYQVQLTAGEDDTYGDVLGYTVHGIE